MNDGLDNARALGRAIRDTMEAEPAPVVRHIFERFANDRPGGQCRVCGARKSDAVHI